MEGPRERGLIGEGPGERRGGGTNGHGGREGSRWKDQGRGGGIDGGGIKGEGSMVMGEEKGQGGRTKGEEGGLVGEGPGERRGGGANGHRGREGSRWKRRRDWWGRDQERGEGEGPMVMGEEKGQGERTKGEEGDWWGRNQERGEGEGPMVMGEEKGQGGRTKGEEGGLMGEGPGANGHGGREGSR